MRILGIDPGLAHTGWGVIDSQNQRYRPVSYGTISTKHLKLKKTEYLLLLQK